MLSNNNNVPIDKKPAPHVHPEQRAKIAGANLVANTFGITAETGPEVSYYSPELIQCTLPHSDPKNRDWIRKNGNFALIVSSGIDGDGEIYGIPYGSFPRLVLAHVITRVIETRDRRIELTSHFGRFLHEIGYTGNHKGTGVKGQRVRDQLMRLLNASISFQYKGENRQSRLNVNISHGFDLWWDFKRPEDDSLFGSWVELSEDFYQAIVHSPVPLRTDILKTLKKSPLALDIYMWVSYRLFSMQTSGQHELSLGYGALQAQFGTGIADENYRQFRSAFKAAFGKVAACYQPHTGDTGKQILHYDLNETGLTLYSSPLLIGRGNRLAKREEVTHILATRTFDIETRRKAKLIAGNWSIEYLTTQYFDWIKDKEPPANLKASFLGFIRSHCKRNGTGP